MSKKDKIIEAIKRAIDSGKMYTRRGDRIEAVAEMGSHLYIEKRKGYDPGLVLDGYSPKPSYVVGIDNTEEYEATMEDWDGVIRAYDEKDEL